MKALVALILCGSLLSGCGAFMTPPVIKIPLGKAAIVYGDFKYLQGVITVTVTALCRDKKLTEVQCVWLAGEAEKVLLIDKDIRRSILDAKGEIDEEKIMAYIATLAGIAIKLSGA